MSTSTPPVTWIYRDDLEELDVWLRKIVHMLGIDGSNIYDRTLLIGTYISTKQATNQSQR